MKKSEAKEREREINIFTLLNNAFVWLDHFISQIREAYFSYASVDDTNKNDFFNFQAKTHV